jgi:hypothetical protein
MNAIVINSAAKGKVLTPEKSPRGGVAKKMEETPEGKIKVEIKMKNGAPALIVSAAKKLLLELEFPERPRLAIEWDIPYQHGTETRKLAWMYRVSESQDQYPKVDDGKRPKEPKRNPSNWSWTKHNIPDELKTAIDTLTGKTGTKYSVLMNYKIIDSSEVGKKLAILAGDAQETSSEE